MAVDIYDEIDTLLHLSALSVISSRAIATKNNDELAGVVKGVCSLVDRVHDDIYMVKRSEEKEDTDGRK